MTRFEPKGSGFDGNDRIELERSVREGPVGVRGGRVRTAVDRLQAKVGFRALSLKTGLGPCELTRLTFPVVAGRQPSSYWYRVRKGTLPYDVEPLRRMEELHPTSTTWFAHPVWMALRVFEISERSPRDRPLRDLQNEAFFAQADRHIPPAPEFEAAERVAEQIFERLFYVPSATLRTFLQGASFAPSTRDWLHQALDVEPLAPWAGRILRCIEYGVRCRVAASPCVHQTK